MEEILLPSKIELIPGENDRKATLVVEPCWHGYGTTLGNAIRRVMLSSLPGAAVTAVKIKGATHEFSAIPGVQEDVLELILNLKQLRFRMFSDEPVRLVLKAKGEKEVTAADIEADSNVEVANPDQHIATLTDKKADFEMEIFVGRGRGYVTVESRAKEKLELGMIAIDAIYSPVREVGYKVENTRVGQITNFDKLLMNIETDGTISPKEAVDQSLKILLDHFQLLSGQSQAGLSAGGDEAPTMPANQHDDNAAEGTALEVEPEETEVSETEDEDSGETPKKAKKATKKKK